MSENLDPILVPNPKRYVVYPIEHPDLWVLYKQAQAATWFTEEVDMSKDLADWEKKLTADERKFVSHVLAFFAASDGIVNENLCTRFFQEVQISEARSFYATQINMENIHCVAPETLILTNKGYFPIKDLASQCDISVNKKRKLDTDAVTGQVAIWNGEAFSNVTVRKTSDCAELYKVVLDNGQFLECTSQHRWLIMRPGEHDLIPTWVYTQDLNAGDIVTPYKLPLTVSHDDSDDTNALLKGMIAGGCILQSATSFIGNAREVPLNGTLRTKIDWLNGYFCNSGGNIPDFTQQKKRVALQKWDADRKFLSTIQLMLSTLQISSEVKDCSEDDEDVFLLIVRAPDVVRLCQMGLNLQIDLPPNSSSMPELKIEHIERNGRFDETYCFSEPVRGMGTFNGILTGQSESYSLMIDTLITDPHEKNKLFNAIETMPAIAKKANWAVKWITDDKASFAQRLLCFAAVEGIFFSGSFASIFWLKKKGLMNGLCSYNEFISRDEGLHVVMAAHLYKNYIVKGRLPKEKAYEIIREAVDIERDFFNDALPVSLLGMNADAMNSYIEYVADMLLIYLGYPKIYGSSNPFEFMENISLEAIQNFFESRVNSYQIRNVLKSASSTSKTKVMELDLQDF